MKSNSLTELTNIIAKGPKGRRPKVLPSSTNIFGDKFLKRTNIPVCANPLERLCELLLPWQLLNSLSEFNLQKNLIDECEEQSILPIGFESFQHYVAVWEPLLIEEIKASILSNFSTSFSKSTSVYFGVPVTEALSGKTDLILLESDFKMPNERIEPPQLYDLLLISKVQIQKDKPTASEYALAMIVSSFFMRGNRVYQLKAFRSSWNVLEKSTTSEKMKNKNDNAGTINCYKLVFTVVDNLRSSWREFQSIHELGNNVFLLPEILSNDRKISMALTPTFEPINEFHEKLETATLTSTINVAIASDPSTDMKSLGLPSKFVKYINSNFNPSQIKAIQRGAEEEGFTLVQGPPGTGKTSTLMGMLNAIHLREYNKYYALAITTVIGREGWNCRQSPNMKMWLNLVSSLSKLKPHILVTAPSNIAVDNIIQRIIAQGFVDGNGGRYNPNILRLGAGKSSKVKVVSLEDTLELEKASYCNDSQRQSNLKLIIDRMNLVLVELMKLQSLLYNLKLAFAVCQPLPAHWELRVATDTLKPYWVDHLNKTTSAEPPSAKIKAEVAAIATTTASTGVVYSLETLPEYLMHSHRLTQLIDELESLNLKYVRLQVYMNGGGGGSNSSSSANSHQLIESSIIEEAALVFTTLNGAGHSSLEATTFRVVVVDEAAQCVEPSLLIPLRRGCTHCIMVGDQKQLPATIFSPKVKAAGYDRPLFERLVAAGHPFIMLNTQYRMHPTISAFPSKQFYHGSLIDGPNVASVTYLPPYLRGAEDDKSTTITTTSSTTTTTTNTAVAVLESFMFFNLCDSREEQTNSQSRINREEVAFCVSLLKVLVKEAKRCGVKVGSIGIITPYSEQFQLLRNNIANNAKRSNSNLTITTSSSSSSSSRREVECDICSLDIECNTVDGFQGREKDIIIISTVRSNDFGNIGFLSDTRRMNVALTRAKVGLFVVGNASTLSQTNPMWREFVAYADRNHVLVRCENHQVDILNAIRLNRMKNRSNGSSWSLNTSSVSLKNDHHLSSSYVNSSNSLGELDYAVQNVSRLKRRRLPTLSSSKSGDTLKSSRIEVVVEEGEVVEEEVVEF